MTVQDETNTMTLHKKIKSFFSFSSLSALGCLNGTQFLGAMNDNIFKLLIVFYFISIDGEAASTRILSAVGAIYVLPFLLLSSIAGTMTDLYSKRTIIVGVKIVECLVMGLGIVAFYLGSKLLAFTALFLLACHSTIFGPCKFGIVPEIVEKERISKANGLISSCTYIAIIAGTFLASFLTDITGRNFIVASGCSLGFALLGLRFSLGITKTTPSGSKKSITPRFLTELFCNLKHIYKEPSLLTAVIGSSFFLFIGSFIQLNLIPFAIESLMLTDVAGGYLFLLCALGIGIGAFLSGKLSGNRVELGLVPFGGFGISLCTLLISLCTGSLAAEIVLITAVGIFGGLYLIPLDSYIQFASPNTFRGQVIATSNFLGFFGVLCSAGLLYFLGEVLNVSPADGFFIIGFISLMVISTICIALSGYIIRFFCMLLNRFYYKGKVYNTEEINSSCPSLYFSCLPSRPWAVLLHSIQPRRLCIFAIAPAAKATSKATSSTTSYITRIKQRLLNHYQIASFDEIAPETTKGRLLLNSLKRGTSIAVFNPHENDMQTAHAFYQKLHVAWQASAHDSSGKALAVYTFTQTSSASTTHFAAELAPINL